MFQIHYFSSDNGEQEFVVISDLPTKEIKGEYEGDCDLVQSLPIQGDASTWPCDRALVKE